MKGLANETVVRVVLMVKVVISWANLHGASARRLAARPVVLVEHGGHSLPVSRHCRRAKLLSFDGMDHIVEEPMPVIAPASELLELSSRAGSTSRESALGTNVAGVTW